jgi:hypothetical protein
MKHAALVRTFFKTGSIIEWPQITAFYLQCHKMKMRWRTARLIIFPGPANGSDYRSSPAKGPGIYEYFIHVGKVEDSILQWIQSPNIAAATNIRVRFPLPLSA